MTRSKLILSVGLPALALFVLPAFCLWFSGHAVRNYDEDIIQSVHEAMDKEPLSPEDKAAARAFYTSNPPSAVCISTDERLTGYRENLKDACSDFEQFSWAAKASWVALAVGAFGMLILLGCSFAAFASRTLQYRSFLFGWHVLRLVSAIEVVVQGVILVWLSYWTTALWFEIYVPKLILLFAFMVVFVIWSMLKAIFAKLDLGVNVEGTELLESRAPHLWSRIRELAARVGTEPPTHIVTGIDDNFFVTEGLVRVGDRELEGRVLYVSLSLLRFLDRTEADAVFCHELGHFVGGDTAYSKKLAPQLSRFERYVEATQAAIPVYLFMRAYQAAFLAGLRKESREREFAADAVAAGQTSPRILAHALIKIGAYSRYRGRVEDSLFEKNESLTSIAIGERVASGFTDYAQTDLLHQDLVDSVVPHPFDTHPKLPERLAALGESVEDIERRRMLLAPTQDPWAEHIPGAKEIETSLWAVYEARFASAHDLALAYRYLPSTDAERIHVEKHFPAMSFPLKKGNGSVALSFDSIRAPEWDEALPLSAISSAEVASPAFRAKRLEIKPLNGGRLQKAKIVPMGKLSEPDKFLAAYNLYVGRDQTARTQPHTGTTTAAP